MSRNTQALILFFASQLGWGLCCVASAPAFVVTNYEEGALQIILMLNGIFITMASSFLMLFAVLVVLDKSPKSQLSPDRLHPMFKIGMGGLAFLLMVQMCLALGQAAMQPNEDDFVAPKAEEVATLEFGAVMKDGQTAGGAYGFVIGHPKDGRPVYVTVSQQFCEGWDLDRDYNVDEVPIYLDYAVAYDQDNELELAEPIAFEADALFASGSGCMDPMSDVFFFDAPGLEKYQLDVEVYDRESKPTRQIFWIVNGDTVEKARFQDNLDEVWEVKVLSGAHITPGAPVLNYKHELVGFVTRNTPKHSEVDVFPMALVSKYLGVYVSL